MRDNEDIYGIIANTSQPTARHPSESQINEVSFEKAYYLGIRPIIKQNDTPENLRGYSYYYSLRNNVSAIMEKDRKNLGYDPVFMEEGSHEYGYLKGFYKDLILLSKLKQKDGGFSNIINFNFVENYFEKINENNLNEDEILVLEKSKDDLKKYIEKIDWLDENSLYENLNEYKNKLEKSYELSEKIYSILKRKQDISKMEDGIEKTNKKQELENEINELINSTNKNEIGLKNFILKNSESGFRKLYDPNGEYEKIKLYLSEEDYKNDQALAKEIHDKMIEKFNEAKEEYNKLTNNDEINIEEEYEKAKKELEEKSPKLTEEINKKKDKENNLKEEIRGYEEEIKEKTKEKGVNAQSWGNQAFASGDNSIAIGAETEIFGENAIGVGKNVSIKSNNAIAIGGNINIENGFENTIVLGNSSEATMANPYGSHTIRNVNYNFAGNNPTSTLSIGSVGKERQITNVAAGRINNSSTDAINGSQLNAVIEELNKLTLNNNIGGDLNFPNIRSENDNLTIRKEGNDIILNINNPNNLNNLSLTSKDRTINVESNENNNGYNLSLNTNNLPKTSFNLMAESGDKKIIEDKTNLKVVGDNNIKTKINDNEDLMVYLNNKIEVEEIKLGENKISKNGLEINKVVINDNGISAGNKKVTEVEDGEIAPNSKEAVNGGQIYNLITNKISHNNVIINEKYSLLNKKVDDLENKINSNNKEMRGAIAGVAAMAGLPEINLPGKSMVAVAAGNYKNQGALAVGYSRISDNNKIKIKLSTSVNTKGNISSSVGIGFAW